MTNLENKVVIITGATQGIGLATAKLLSAKGAKTVLVARSENDLKNISEQIPNSFAIQADVRDADAVEKMIQKTMEQFGRVDVLINNAAQGLNALIEKINLDDFRKIILLSV